MLEENFVPLDPVNYFQIGADCNRLEGPLTSKNMRGYLLPDTSALCEEEHFADVALGWSTEKLEIMVNVKEAFQEAYYPEVTKGDSIELFFDTRDVKTSGFNTRFCHHFFFLPESVEGQIAGEITRFRTEDVHELCDANELKVKCEFKSQSYQMHITIPSHCLNGYDPEQFDRLGFTYRINRAGGSPQHFSATTEDYQIEQQPSLWSSLRLKK
jgi:hypothetical protein